MNATERTPMATTHRRRTVTIPPNVLRDFDERVAALIAWTPPRRTDALRMAVSEWIRMREDSELAIGPLLRAIGAGEDGICGRAAGEPEKVLLGFDDETASRLDELGGKFGYRVAGSEALLCLAAIAEWSAIRRVFPTEPVEEIVGSIGRAEWKAAQEWESGKTARAGRAARDPKRRSRGAGAGADAIGLKDFCEAEENSDLVQVASVKCLYAKSLTGPKARRTGLMAQLMRNIETRGASYQFLLSSRNHEEWIEHVLAFRSVLAPVEALADRLVGIRVTDDPSYRGGYVLHHSGGRALSGMRFDSFDPDNEEDYRGAMLTPTDVRRRVKAFARTWEEASPLQDWVRSQGHASVGDLALGLKRKGRRAAAG